MKAGALPLWAVVWEGTTGLGQRLVPLSLTNLLDAFLVLDEQLDPGDVNVQPGALGWPFDRRVKASVILAVGRGRGEWVTAIKG